MMALVQRMQASPMGVRVIPFVAFLILTAGQGQFGESSRYWLYLLKTLAGVCLIYWMRPHVPEMRWTWSWSGVGVGVAVFLVWVGLDGLIPGLDTLLRRISGGSAPAVAVASPSWNPFAAFGDNSPLAWTFVLTRILGSSLIVPPLEETFYRSFVYRYMANPDFEKVPLNRFQPVPFLVTAAIFGFAHREWLAGILCAMAYQALVLRHNRLGDAMLAHAVTNLLLGLWVVGKGAWQFW